MHVAFMHGVGKRLEVMGAYGVLAAQQVRRSADQFVFNVVRHSVHHGLDIAVPQPAEVGVDKEVELGALGRFDADPAFHVSLSRPSLLPGGPCCSPSGGALQFRYAQAHRRHENAAKER